MNAALKTLGIFFFVAFVSGWVVANAVQSANFQRYDYSTGCTQANFSLSQYSDKLDLDVEGATYSLVSDTKSNFPFLDANQTVILTPYKGETLCKGMFVVYQAEALNDMKVLHQIVGICEGGYVTKGTSNFLDDGCIEKERIKQILVGAMFSPPKEFYTGSNVGAFIVR